MPGPQTGLSAIKIAALAQAQTGRDGKRLPTPAALAVSRSGLLSARFTSVEALDTWLGRLNNPQRHPGPEGGSAVWRGDLTAGGERIRVRLVYVP